MEGTVNGLVSGGPLSSLSSSIRSDSSSSTRLLFVSTTFVGSLLLKFDIVA
jgi:hypothetical protein